MSSIINTILRLPPKELRPLLYSIIPKVKSTSCVTALNIQQAAYEQHCLLSKTLSPIKHLAVLSRVYPIKNLFVLQHKYIFVLPTVFTIQ